MTDYLKEDIIAAVGGSWIASKDLIASGQWDQIALNAGSAVQAFENLDK